MTNPVLIMLCGIPGSGKTTYCTRGGIENPSSYVTISSDNIIMDMAKDQYTTYNLIWDKVIGEATELMHNRLEEALGRGANIIWDATNLTPQVRMGKLSLIPPSYDKIAVWFDTDLSMAILRNSQRWGKFVPRRVLMQMAADFVPPTLAEGFDLIKLAGGNKS